MIGGALDSAFWRIRKFGTSCGWFRAARIVGRTVKYKRSMHRNTSLIRPAVPPGEVRYPPIATEFEDATLDDLGNAMFEASLVLRTGKRRTAEERAMLASRCAELLARSAMRLCTDSWKAGSPETLMRLGERLSDVFPGWLRSEYRNLRWIGIQRAAAVAFGSEAVEWLKENDQMDASGYSPSIETDEGFDRLMAEINAEQQRRTELSKQR